MIEYSLEWLASSGIEKVHLFCCAHADQIRDYIERSAKWRAGNCDMEIHIMMSYKCRSAGEALRLVDHEGLIRDDFVLLSCDCITNMDLGAALDSHKGRRRAPSSPPSFDSWSPHHCMHMDTSGCMRYAYLAHFEPTPALPTEPGF
jgi:NDP-sugar pyrophosphorylase family protein